MLGRSVATLLLRLLLVIGLSWGVTGLMTADLVVTVALLPILWPWMRPLLRMAFSGEDLRESLRFGLPRLPHGVAQQAFDAGNKYLLNHFVPLGQLGVYQIATTLGQSIKFFLSAFETGWAPFYYETSRQPNARETFSKITTYGVALLTLLVAGLTAITGDLVRLLTTKDYADASTLVPIIAFGIAWQGVYLLTSIGLNLSNKTNYYPVSTFLAAGVGLGTGWYLMPRYGVTGAALSFLASYVTLALIAGAYSRRFYPMRYETGRLARVVAAGVVAALAALALPHMKPLAGVLARGCTVVAVFGGLLWAGGFLRPTERALVKEILAAARNRGRTPARGGGRTDAL
jgi:O-antigen/teichoic acid export membrane protein